MASLQVDINLSANKPHHIFSEDQTISPVVKELAKHSAMSVDLALVRMQPIAPDTADEAVGSPQKGLRLYHFAPSCLLLPLYFSLLKAWQRYLSRNYLTRRLLLRPRKVVLLWLCTPHASGWLLLRPRQCQWYSTDMNHHLGAGHETTPSEELLLELLVPNLDNRFVFLYELIYELLSRHRRTVAFFCARSFKHL